MKCPYRTKVTHIKPEPRTLITSDGKITITRIETTDFENCCEEDCPFYRDDGTRFEPYCMRVELETGGDSL